MLTSCEIRLWVFRLIGGNDRLFYWLDYFYVFTVQMPILDWTLSSVLFSPDVVAVALLRGAIGQLYFGRRLCTLFYWLTFLLFSHYR